MDEFDKEFEQAPDAAFDDEFEKAPSPEAKPSFLSSSLQNLSDIGSELKPIADTAQDFGISATQGATLGAADEIGGGLAALLEKGASFIPGTDANKSKQVDEALKAQGFQVPDESLADSYRSYQKGSEQAFKDAGDRSPIANTLGNIGGSVTTGIGLGNALGIGKSAKNAESIYDVYKNSGKMKAGLELLKRGGSAYAKAAPAIAAESALVSEGNLDNAQSREELGQDVLGGLAFGLPAVVGAEGLTDFAAPAAKAGLNYVDDKFGKFVESNPFLRKYKIGIKHGERGTKPTSSAGLEKLEMEQIDRTKGMLDNVYAADKTLGKAVGKSIQDATDSGQLVDVSKSLKDTLEALDYSYNNLADISENAKGRQIFEKIQKGATNLTPSEAKYLLDDVDSYRERFKSIRVPGPLVDERIVPALNKFRNNLSEQLKTEVPKYAEAAKRFTEFRHFVPETILSKERPVDVTNVFMGNLRNLDQKLYDSLNDLQLGATSQGSGSSNIRKAYGNTIGGMKQFEANELARGTKSPLVQSADEFDKQLRGFSDEAQFLKDVQTVKSPFVTGQNLVSTVGQLGHSGALSSSLLVGRAKKPISDISRKAYNMPAEKLNELADKITAAPGLKTLGQALKDGLTNGDQAKKNAAIFSIMQHPEARLFFQDDNE